MRTSLLAETLGDADTVRSNKSSAGAQYHRYPINPLYRQSVVTWPTLVQQKALDLLGLAL